MDDRQDYINEFAWRVPVAIVLFAIAWWLFSSSVGKVDSEMVQLAGLACAVAGAIIFGPLFAILIAAPTGSLFFPRGHSQSQPHYSGAIGRRMRARYDDAIEEYQRIADEFPGELYPHLAMMEIAFLDLHDAERADAITRRGLIALADEASRDQLRRSHRVLKEKMLSAIEEAEWRTARDAAEAKREDPGDDSDGEPS